MGIVLAIIAGAGISSFNLGLDNTVLTYITIFSSISFSIWFFKLSKPRKNNYKF